MTQHIDDVNVFSTLDKIDVGREVKVVSIDTEKKDVLHILTLHGILPGTVLSLVQRKPVLVVQIRNSQLAFERSIGKEITVRNF